MTSDATSIRNQFSKTKLWLTRQATSMTTDGSQSHGRSTDSTRLSRRKRQSLQTLDGSQPAERQSDSYKPLSRSPTELNAVGSEPKGDHTPGNGQVPPLPAKSSTINVVLFGETGVGKSSVINLIARKDIAKVSSDVNGCTMQYQRYDIPFDDMNFSIFDTIGLEEPQMGVNGYLKAIEKAYELISKLSAAGGIHLLLFCMRGGRITATTQSNYRLFCECLCDTKVPIALVFTGLEREEEMENWWKRNRTHIEHYGIKSDGHACITAVQDDTPDGEDHKYMESQKTIRELLKNSARKGEAFSLESQRWFARLGRQMKSFVSGKRSPKRRDVMKVLTNRCKLDPETAKKIADMMEKGEEGEGGKENDVPKNPANDDVVPDEHDFEIVSDVAGNREKDVKNKYAAEVAPPKEPNIVKAAPNVGNEKGDAGGDDPRVAEQKRKTQDAVSATGVIGDVTRRRNVAEDTPHQEPNSVEAAPYVKKEVNDVRKPGEKENVGPRIPVKPPNSERRDNHLARGDPTPVVTSVGRPQPQ